MPWCGSQPTTWKPTGLVLPRTPRPRRRPSRPTHQPLRRGHLRLGLLVGNPAAPQPVPAQHPGRRARQQRRGGKSGRPQLLPRQPVRRRQPAVRATNGRVDYNTTFRTKTITFEVGWSQAGTADVVVDHNVSHDDNYVIYVDSSRRAQVSETSSTPPGRDPDQPGERGSPGRRKHRHGRCARAGAGGCRRRDHRHQAGDDRSRDPTEHRAADGGAGGQHRNRHPGHQRRAADRCGHRRQRRHGQCQRGVGARPRNHGNEIVRNILSDNGTNGIRLSPGTTMNVLRDNVALGTPRTPATWRCSRPA